MTRQLSRKGSWLLVSLVLSCNDSGLSVPEPQPNSAAVTNGLTCVRPSLEGMGDIDAEIDFNTYSIQGSTVEALRNSLNERGPGGHDAYTAWYVTWNLLGSDCTQPSPQIGLTITYTFPRWEERRGASPELVSNWNRYEQALLCHEHQHAKIGIRAARETARQMATITPKNCRQKQELGEQIFQQILTDHQAMDRVLDARTQHGATEGAVFP